MIYFCTQIMCFYVYVKEVKHLFPKGKCVKNNERNVRREHRNKILHVCKVHVVDELASLHAAYIQ